MKSDNVLLVSIFSCVVLLVAFYLIVLRSIEPGTASVNTDVVQFTGNYPLCDTLLTKGTIDAGTICVHLNTRQLQTYSDVQVWDFTKRAWVNAIGLGNPAQKTVFIAGSDDYNKALPVVIKCTWGCILGYLE